MSQMNITAWGGETIRTPGAGEAVSDKGIVVPIDEATSTESNHSDMPIVGVLVG